MAHFPVQINFHTKSADLAKRIIDELGIDEHETIDRAALERVNEGRLEEMRARKKEPLRPGIGDTGKAVFGKQGVNHVRLDQYFEDLLAQGFQPAYKVWHKTSVRDQKTQEDVDKFTIRVVVALKRDIHTELPPEFTETFRAFLASGVWSHCHVWQNNKNDTVNVTGQFERNVRRYRVLRLDDHGDYTTPEAIAPSQDIAINTR
ncbi:MAG: hypothetical protein WC787_01335 [Patescibacteria group bacterium]|jgi:hypothetical protein